MPSTSTPVGIYAACMSELPNRGEEATMVPWLESLPVAPRQRQFAAEHLKAWWASSTDPLTQAEADAIRFWIQGRGPRPPFLPS